MDSIMGSDPRLYGAIYLRQRDPDASTLRKKYSDDAGVDITCLHTRIVLPHQIVNFDSGWDVAIGKGFWGAIKTRSSTFYKRKLMVMDSVLDHGYKGPLSVVVFNPTIIPRIIRAGDRLAQLILIPQVQPILNLNDDVFLVYRGGERFNKGFGSTGKGRWS